MADSRTTAGLSGGVCHNKVTRIMKPNRIARDTNIFQYQTGFCGPTGEVGAELVSWRSNYMGDDIEG